MTLGGEVHDALHVVAREDVTHRSWSRMSACTKHTFVSSIRSAIVARFPA